jgi:hypothetical protein
VCERIFGVSNKRLVHNLKGNSQALQKPRTMSSSHDPRSLAIWDMGEFDKAFANYAYEVYDTMEHPALGVSPRTANQIGVARAGRREHTFIPYTPEFQLACMPSTKRGVSTIVPGRGVKISHIYYWSGAFRDMKVKGVKVPTRYNPLDKSKAFAYLGGNWLECRSEYASAFEGRSEKEIAIITKEITGKNKRDGKRRTINAETIARSLRTVDATQKLLTQRKRDAERKNADRPGSKFVPAEPLETEDVAPLPPKDLWADLPVTQYGEFK